MAIALAGGEQPGKCGMGGRAEQLSAVVVLLLLTAMMMAMNGIRYVHNERRKSECARVRECRRCKRESSAVATEGECVPA